MSMITRSYFNDCQAQGTFFFCFSWFLHPVFFNTISSFPFSHTNPRSSVLWQKQGKHYFLSTKNISKQPSKYNKACPLSFEEKVLIGRFSFRSRLRSNVKWHKKNLYWIAHFPNEFALIIINQFSFWPAVYLKNTSINFLVLLQLVWPLDVKDLLFIFHPIHALLLLTEFYISFYLQYNHRKYRRLFIWLYTINVGCISLWSMTRRRRNKKKGRSANEED